MQNGNEVDSSGNPRHPCDVPDNIQNACQHKRTICKTHPAQNPQHNEPRLRTKNKNVCNMHDCLPQNVTLRGPSWPIHHNWSLECLQRRLRAGIHERSWSCKLPHNLRMSAPEPTRLCRGHQPVCVAGFQCFS